MITGFQAGVMGVRRLWTPVEITTELWLDANDNTTFTLVSDRVSQWRDISGNSRHLSQSSDAQRPRRIAGAVSFLSSSAQYLATDSPLLSDDIHSAFCVYTASPQALGPGILMQHDGPAATGRVIYLALSYTSPYSTLRYFFNNGTSYIQTGTTVAVVTDQKNMGFTQSDGVGNWALRANGGSEEAVLTGQTLSPLQVPFRIGGYTSNYLTGAIHEVIMASSVFSEATRQKVEGYLAHKWGLTARLPSDHPYRYSAPTV